MVYIYLFIAILSEVIATTFLKISSDYGKFYFFIIVAISYFISFFFLSLSLKILSISIVYACWSGLGTICITIIDWFFYNKKLDLFVIIGIILIILGILVIKIFSKSLIN